MYSASYLPSANRSIMGTRSAGENKTVQQPCCADDWSNLGFSLQDEERISVPSGEVVSKKDCFVAAAAAEPHDSANWNNLGFVIANNEPANVAGQTLSKRDCYLRALTCDPRNGAAWNNLGYGLRDGECASFQGRMYSKADCFLKALETDTSDSAAWNNVGFTLPPCGTATLGMQSFGKRECFEQAVRCDEQNSAAWFNLANCLSSGDGACVPNVGGPFSRQQCLLKAVNDDPLYSAAWAALADTIHAGETVHADKRIMNRDACLREASRGTDEHLPVWLRKRQSGQFRSTSGYTGDGSYGMGRSIAGNGQRTYDFGRAMQYMTPQSTGPQTVKKERRGREHWLRSLEYDTNNANAWYNLGCSLKSDGETVTIGRERHTQLDCFAKALTLNSEDGQTWNNVGADMAGDNGKVMVNHRQFDSLQCFQTACECDMNCPEPWMNLSRCLDMLPAGSTARVAGQGYTAQRCRDMSTEAEKRRGIVSNLERNPHDGDSWRRLGNSMPEHPGLHSSVLGRRYSKTDCYARASDGADGSLNRVPPKNCPPAPQRNVYDGVGLFHGNSFR